MQFLSTSLEKLSAQLKEGLFTNLAEVYPDSAQMNLLRKKGVYPYDYMDSTARFDETNLPGKEKFYNRLENKHISAKDYAHAQIVWDMFCTTMQCYHDLYLKGDVLLLADVFENFRIMALQTYKLDPVHYYSLPGLSWDAMLKYTDVELDLITDMDMYQMVEKGMRGGISQISHRYASANLSDMDTYKEPRRTLMYQDANALCSWAMSQLLPTKRFKWIDPIDVLELPDDNPLGYILEVDLEYPQELHDRHNGYPLAAEYLQIRDDILSPFQREQFPSNSWFS